MDTARSWPGGHILDFLRDGLMVDPGQTRHGRCQVPRRRKWAELGGDSGPLKATSLQLEAAQTLTPTPEVVVFRRRA